MVRFDRPCRYVYRAANYFSNHMNRKDYLTEGDRVEMTWAGKGAGRLELIRLCKGKHPVSNEKLMVRDNGANRRVCYFGQISAPKDASIAYLVGGDQRIADWWKESVKETIREIEGVTATRVHEGNKVTDRPSEMVAAVVTHDTSRALDPQLHTHVCIMNVTYDPVEKRWKAVEPHGYYKYQSYLREVSYNKLAEKMKEGGYQLEKARSSGFTIKGFPGDLRENFSKRREEIERVADVLKTRDQDKLQSIATNTRAKKVYLDPAELSRRWKNEAAPHLAGIEKDIRSTETPIRSTPMTPENALSLAVSHVFDRHSIVDERLLLREALIVGRGDVTLDQLKVVLRSKIESGEIIRSGKIVTTPEMLALEKSIVSWASQGRNTLPPGGLHRADEKLSREQNRAVEKLLNSGDRVSVLIGDAGAGKSTTLPAFIRGVHEAGGLTFACAPSSGAAMELHDKLKIQADTVQQLLVNQKLQEQVSMRQGCFLCAKCTSSFSSPSARNAVCCWWVT
jgi:conjugative relaxase-like TrwC/TraI family protein